MSAATTSEQQQQQQQSASATDNEWRPIGEAVGAGDLPVDVIDSLCMQCHEQGVTRMLLTVIPYFKEVIVVSFRCEHCGYTNNEIQSAGAIQSHGAVYTVKIHTRKDLDRQLVKSEHCVVSIPEYALQIPAGRGQFTTVEGIISDTVRDLSSDQPKRKVEHPELHDQLQALIDKLLLILEESAMEKAEVLAGTGTEGGRASSFPKFTIKLDDCSGNSFIETEGGLTDPQWSKMEYPRDAAQDEMLGLAHDDEKAETSHYPEEVMSFPGTCSLCGSHLETLMKTVSIPHFKDIILMATNCHDCGYRDTEVKSGGATSAQGRKITLKVEDSDDLSRDVLKSDTAGMLIPEIDLELNPGTLGGRFTTLEGLLNQVYEELDEKVFAHGDAALPGATDHMAVFLANLKKVMTCAIPFTVIIDDPLANSFIQNLNAPDPDSQLEIEDYDRTEEQDNELGISDMRVEEGTY